MDWILAPFQYAFMQNGMAAAVLIGITCALLGVYVVLRQMAFIGDALAHTTLPGLVIAYLQNWNLFWGAVCAAIITALGIGWLTRDDDLQEDTAIGVVFTGMFALGILLMSTARSFRDLSHILFGNIIGVTHTDLIQMAIIAAVVAATLLLFHKELELTSYDPTHAEVIGLRAGWVRYGLLVLLALAVVAGIQTVGVILISALLVTPAATAAMITNRLPRMMAIASAVAVGSGIVGLYASYYTQISSGAAMVLVCTICFGIAWAWQQIRQT